jgi:glycosyltransferase involved in cell wall biosynthesis
MLVIITTHPIQYQAPLWRALAEDGRVPFEVWFLTHHAVSASPDLEFGRTFAWDLDMLGGYPNRTLPVARGATPTSFLKCRLVQPLAPMLKQVGARAVWIQGWQVMAYWQAARAAGSAGCELWLRAESNDLAPVAWWKLPAKRLALSWLFDRVDRFLCIGAANKRLYRAFGVPPSRLSDAPYAVDNDRFAKRAAELRDQRALIRRKWAIDENAVCFIFCGKLIQKKRPLDLVEAARMTAGRIPRLHLLFVGSGELGAELRRSCEVAFDGEESADDNASKGQRDAPLASFVGFLNQTEISQAYVAADCLVLPSDCGETWGLVVNEAMASGLSCIVSNRCGCAEDLGTIPPNRIFSFGDKKNLSNTMIDVSRLRKEARANFRSLTDYSFERTVQTVVECSERLRPGQRPSV